ncbi:MAG: efflux RND transporter periplasmic adaptor subunit [Phycisphaerales bacterium]
MKRSSLVASICIFVGLAAIGGGLGYSKWRSIVRAAANDQHFEPPQAIDLAVAHEVPWQRTADLVGTVVAERSVTVSNELAGTIKEVRFDSGSIVEPGDVLLTLDDSSDRADLAAAQASVRVARANVAVAESRVWLTQSEERRLQSAAELSAASRIELDRATSEAVKARADRDRAMAEVDLAEARVAQVQTRLDKMTIKAPFRGRTGLRTMHEGQYLAEGSSVVSLNSVGDRIFLDFAIPQEHIARVKPGVAVMATGDVLGQKPMRIEVVAIDSAVNNNTRNVRVRSVVDNRDDRLRPGMFVQINVPVDAEQRVLVVPSSAVRRTSYADQVFVIVPGAEPGQLRAQQRFVKLGPTIGEETVVREGLSAGETVASSGAFKLRDGALVAPQPAPATAPLAARTDQPPRDGGAAERRSSDESSTKPGAGAERTGSTTADARAPREAAAR